MIIAAAIVAITFLVFLYVKTQSSAQGGRPGRSANLEEASADATRIMARMKAMAAPTLLLTPTAASGFSKLGGYPELPAGTSWPVGPEGPLGFLLQVDLAAARAAGGPEWLPSEGLIYLFHDDRFGLRDQLRVVVSTARAGPVATPPNDLPIRWRYPERRVGFSARTSLPSLDWLGEDVRKIDVEDDELDRLSDVTGVDLGEGPHHRIGGYPEEIQDERLPVAAEFEARGLEQRTNTPLPADILKAAEDWRLLIQIDSDPKLKMNWGDGGMFYLMVREGDARAGDFTQTVTLSQSY